jgi:hypothetical protein
MPHKKIYLLLITLLFSYITAFAQPTTLHSIDTELTQSYKALLHAHYEGNPDSIAPLFKKQILKRLENPLTFNNSLDSLAQVITIKTSADKKIKFYSWDECTGGTWHLLFCVAQFKSKSGKIIVQPITTGDEMEKGGYTDSRVYEINQLSIRDTTFYLTFSWGTHGAGHEHEIAQLFKIDDDKLVRCKSCFAGDDDLVLEHWRAQPGNLYFDVKTNEISYNEIEEETEEYDGKVIVLKWVNRVFVKE